MKTLIRALVVYILQTEARLVISKYRPFVIAVTGSIGKTSTKDAIFSVLTGRGADHSPGVLQHIRKSDKSLNSEFGVPLTILGSASAWNDPLAWLGIIFRGLELIFFRSEYPNCLVLEVGADHPGDIRRIARWLSPDIAVVTTIGAVPVHIEFFPSRDALIDEKLSFARVMCARGKGVLVLPADDTEILAKVKGMMKKDSGDDSKKDSKKKSTIEIFTYGIDTPATITATSVETMYESMSTAVSAPTGISFKLNHAGNSIPVRLSGVLGIQHVFPMLAAAAVGIARRITLSAIVDAVGMHVPPRGRMNIIPGVNGCTVIDDTYNASPSAVALALETVRSLVVPVGSRRIIVLGDMMELGAFSQEEHRKIGAKVADVLRGSTMNMLVTVGQRAKMIREGAIAGGMSASSIMVFDSSNEAAHEVAGMAKLSDIILVKGSQSPRMERVVKALLIDQGRADELLVRQEPEWLARA